MIFARVCAEANKDQKKTSQGLGRSCTKKPIKRTASSPNKRALLAIMYCSAYKYLVSLTFSVQLSELSKGDRYHYKERHVKTQVNNNKEKQNNNGFFFWQSIQNNIEKQNTTQKDQEINTIVEELKRRGAENEERSNPRKDLPARGNLCRKAKYFRRWTRLYL